MNSYNIWGVRKEECTYMALTGKKKGNTIKLPKNGKAGPVARASLELLGHVRQQRTSPGRWRVKFSFLLESDAPS